MPFGLKNTAQVLQYLMDTVSHSLHFVFVYLDDILVFSCLTQAHYNHLRLFQCLHLHGLVMSIDNWQFGSSTIDFFGMLLEGMIPLPDKVEAIRKFPMPTVDKGLQEFYFDLCNIESRCKALSD